MAIRIDIRQENILLISIFVGTGRGSPKGLYRILTGRTITHTTISICIIRWEAMMLTQGN